MIKPVRVCAAAILAGGTSSRMGRDKAMLRVGGVPMLERIVRSALQACEQVWVVGREKPLQWPEKLSVQFVPDAVPQPGSSSGKPNDTSAGPLVGLVTALKHMRGPLLVLACDMPLVSPALLRALLRAHDPQSPATIAQMGDAPEPLLGIYSPRLLPRLRRMLRENRRALYPLASVRGVRLWPVPAARVSEVMNVNDPPSLAPREGTCAGVPPLPNP